MNTRINKAQENKETVVSNDNSKDLGNSNTSLQFDDQRPEAVAQGKLQQMANQYSGDHSVAQLQALANKKTLPLRKAPQQATASKREEVQTIQKKENKTGLPDNLKAGVESLSGHSMDDVKVHYNSAKPAQLNAHAYAQGTDIHLASGQEKHLPHEAWHVVQQKQGRVEPTLQMKEKVAINDDVSLEKEADVMGEKAIALSTTQKKDGPLKKQPNNGNVDIPFQRKLIVEDKVGSGKFMEAFEIFESALRKQGGRISRYLKFVDSKTNNHNLIFRTILAKPKGKDQGKLHGVTNVTFSGTPTDILDHMFKEDIDPDTRINEIMERIDITEVLNGVDVLIDILIYPDSEVPILLETLNHEFTVHAIQWDEFVASVYTRESLEAKLRTRIQSMKSDHDNFGTDNNDMYRRLRQTIFEAIDTGVEPELGIFGLPETQASEFMEISRDAIQQHRPYELVKQDLENLEKRTSDLTTETTPLFKRKPPKPKNDDGCCYITTACIQAQGLPDDCEELTVLRGFRDSYLKGKSNGESLIALYYEHSPKILEHIHRSEDEEEILRRLYRIIKKCVEAIKKGDNEYAYTTYCEMVIKLKNKYIADLKVTIPELYI